jgi:G:T-mismatch repair DNA endonuclease (very short patch repair protein)
LNELGWNVLVIWECETKDEAKLREKLLRFMTGE